MQILFSAELKTNRLQTNCYHEDCLLDKLTRCQGQVSQRLNRPVFVSVTQQCPEWPARHLHTPWSFTHQKIQGLNIRHMKYFLHNIKGRVVPVSYNIMLNHCFEDSKHVSARQKDWPTGHNLHGFLQVLRGLCCCLGPRGSWELWESSICFCFCCFNIVLPHCAFWEEKLATCIVLTVFSCLFCFFNMVQLLLFSVYFYFVAEYWFLDFCCYLQLCFCELLLSHASCVLLSSVSLPHCPSFTFILKVRSFLPLYFSCPH